MDVVGKQELTNLWLAVLGGLILLLIALSARLKKSFFEGVRAVWRYWPLWITFAIVIVIVAPIVAGARAAASRHRAP